MTKQPTVSLQKIIIFLVFVCGAIMASLFVYRTNHQETPTVIANGNATLFSVARDIKEFNLVSSRHTKFSERDLRGHWSLIFFGFTHCSTVCPETFKMLSAAYPALHAIDPHLQIVFVSLDPERDAPQNLTDYVNSFNPAFIGVTGNIQVIRKLQSQLGIYSEREASSENGDYQIQHSSSIILINPKGQWAGLFKFGMSPQEFSAAFKQVITESSDEKKNGSDQGNSANV